MEKKRKQEDLLTEAKNFFSATKKEIIGAVREGERVIHLPFSRLAQFSPELADNLIDSPEETIALLKMPLKNQN